MESSARTDQPREIRHPARSRRCGTTSTGSMAGIRPKSPTCRSTEQRAVYDAMCRAFHAGLPGRGRGQRRHDRRRRPRDPDPALPDGGQDAAGDSSSIITAAASSSAGSTAMTTSAPRSAPAPALTCSRSTTGWRRSICIRPPSTMRCAVFEWAAATTDLPIVLCGESAGGNLAAAVAQATRSHPRRAIGQVLIYPGLGGDESAGSYVEHARSAAADAGATSSSTATSAPARRSRPTIRLFRRCATAISPACRRPSSSPPNAIRCRRTARPIATASLPPAAAPGGTRSRGWCTVSCAPARPCRGPARRSRRIVARRRGARQGRLALLKPFGRAALRNSAQELRKSEHFPSQPALSSLRGNGAPAIAPAPSVCRSAGAPNNRGNDDEVHADRADLASAGRTRRRRFQEGPA